MYMYITAQMQGITETRASRLRLHAETNKLTRDRKHIYICGSKRDCSWLQMHSSYTLASCGHSVSWLYVTYVCMKFTENSL